MTFASIEAKARAAGLEVLGGLRTPLGHPLRHGRAETVLLLGPDEPGFWPMFRDSAEFLDGQPDPLDRWSRRVIGALAETAGAEAFFPFGGPPFLPFVGWALEASCVTSPVRLLAHPRRGLFVSFRGALGLPETIDLPPAAPGPCASCEARPCVSACPVAALTEAGYDADACRAYLETPEGADCRQNGCAVRRACPVGTSLRMPEQSAFHMKAFHPWD